MIIAIDGTSASGKGTLAKRLANRFNLAHLDTGALYRITAQMLRKQGIASDAITAENAVKVAENLNLSLMDDPSIRTTQAGEMASIVAAIPQVRAALKSFQQSFAQQSITNIPAASKEGTSFNGAVLDGRDIGTVILPDADVKFFVAADLAIRAERRFAELKTMGENISLNDIQKALADRDERDRMRKTSPLIPADDAILIDTSTMGVEATVDFACDYLPK